MTSAVATESTEFQLNRAHYLARPGSPSFTGAGRKRQGACLHTSRGRLLPRERIAGLIDAGSPFLDFGYLAREGMYDGVPPGATIITGVGQVCGRSCMLIGNDATVKGGTLFGMTAKKHTRAQLFAWQHRLPCITWCSLAVASCRACQYLSGRRAGRIDHVQSSEDVGIAQIAIDSHALAIARNIVANLGEPPQLRWTPQEPGAPCYAPEEIYGIVSANKRIPTDNREIVARLIDGSRFQGFKHLYGETMMCGFARINGFEIGILANNGVLFSESAIKGAHFIELCCKRDIRYCFWSTSRALWSAPPSNGRELPSMARCS